MATVTKTIGTTSRDFSTMTLWEADLDDDPTYDAGDDAVGECYDDSAFDEIILVNGGTTIGLNTRKLTVASAERHDGTAGTGVRNVRTADFSLLLATGGNIVTTFEWLEIGGNNQNGVALITLNLGAATDHFCTKCIVHDINRVNGIPIGLEKSNSSGRIYNNILYDILNDDATENGSTARGISSQGSTRIDSISNNTVFNVGADNSTVGISGLWFNDNSAKSIQNNISMGTFNDGSGAGNDYEPSSASNATVDHNLASDTTASGTGSLDSKVVSTQFVSTTGGSEDLHIKSGSDAIDVGTDLGTTPSGVEIDIDGRDRDAEGDTWDMGAHELVAAGGANPHGPLGHPLWGPLAGPVVA